MPKITINKINKFFQSIQNFIQQLDIIFINQKLNSQEQYPAVINKKLLQIFPLQITEYMINELIFLEIPYMYWLALQNMGSQCSKEEKQLCFQATQKQKQNQKCSCSPVTFSMSERNSSLNKMSTNDGQSAEQMADKILFINATTNFNSFHAQDENGFIPHKTLKKNGDEHRVDYFKQKLETYLYCLEPSQYERAETSRLSILKWLQKHFKSSKQTCILVFRGRGHKKTGNWIIQTLEKPLGDNFSLDEIINLWDSSKTQKAEKLILVLDSDYAGKWVQKIQRKGTEDIQIFATCSENDENSRGGSFLKTLICSPPNLPTVINKIRQFQTPILYTLSQGKKQLELQDIEYLRKMIKNKMEYVELKFDEGVYEGETVEGCRDGSGTIYYKKGGKYCGQWKKDKRNGKGKLVYPNKQRYEGQWLNDLKHGSGISNYKNGDRYDGNWKQDKKHGFGIYYYKKGDRYEGQWKNGVKHGKGIQYYQNGDKYDGQWSSGTKQGYGVYYFTNGKDKGCTYKGAWKKGKMHGKACYYWSDGSWFQGTYQNDIKNGKAIFHTKKGQKIPCQFTSGVLIKKSQKNIKI